MRKRLVAGNWKMNKTPKEALELTELLKDKVNTEDTDVVFCVPFVDIAAVSEALKGTNIAFGAQNLYFEDNRLPICCCRSFGKTRLFWRDRRNCKQKDNPGCKIRHSSHCLRR